MTALSHMGLTTRPDHEEPAMGPQSEQTLTDEPLYTVPEIAKHLRVSTETVLRTIRRGELPALRLRREYRITKAAWDAYFASLTPATAVPGQGAV